jgi:hypothetical protein
MRFTKRQICNEICGCDHPSFDESQDESSLDNNDRPSSFTQSCQSKRMLAHNPAGENTSYVVEVESQRALEA